jgi:hypothetical protein
MCARGSDINLVPPYNWRSGMTNINMEVVFTPPNYVMGEGR